MAYTHNYIPYNCDIKLTHQVDTSSLCINLFKSSPMAYKHNYILYNCDIILIQEIHALTYPFPHKSSHSFHQFQAPNIWTFLVHFTQTRNCFYSPKTEQVGCPRAAHSSYIGSSWWNRIPMAIPGLIPTKHNLMHIL